MVLGLLLGFLLVAVVPARAVPPDSSTSSVAVILAIGHVRPGCVPDTVYGVRGDDFTWRPTCIAWGGYDSLRTPPCFPGHGSRPRRARTTFEYPAWPHFEVSLSVEYRSLGDTLLDLVWHYWGAYPDTTNRYSSARSLVVFGQTGLDSIDVINLATLPGVQTVPFFAMDLVVGSHLVEPEHRDLSGISSFVLLPIGAGAPPAPKLQGPVSPPWQVALYPNPAERSTSIEGHLVPPGEYRVEVISSAGAVALRQEISVQESGDLFGTLDLATLPSGFYVVRLYSTEISSAGSSNAGTSGVRSSAEIRVGDFPIVKTR